ncbi:hypothetical protein ACIQNG_10070 [Streptomyces sp. NPDC091377]|uniref:hypothetical protein n=1 Tax=Streptomyces sp. NPDC091377 TaxID=3365995 RepID=UPI0037F7EAA3
MPSSLTTPPTVWLARGHHTAPGAADLLRRTLRRHKDAGTLDDFHEHPEAGTAGVRGFEARWRVAGPVTVRARLDLADTGRWSLAAEAEGAWELRWPSPATMFWPADEDTWASEPATGLRLQDINPLPSDERELRRILKSAAQDSWAVHVVVHEAMTPDERGLRPLAAVLPPGLRHRVVEHRAAPQQLRSVNWALRDTGVEVPRGGAAVLPGDPAPPGHGAEDFTVRSVFLDGTEPAELITAVTRFAALDRPLPEGADALLTTLREDWHLLTVREELDRERRLVAMYADALDAMTKSRDLYREAAEAAHEALAVYRETYGALAEPVRPAEPVASPFRQLTQSFGRLRIPGRRTEDDGTSGTSRKDAAGKPDAREAHADDGDRAPR